jgi:hypothetical protein
VCKRYAKGGSSAVETTNDGVEFIKQLDGSRQPGERISAYLEVTCDDNEKGAEDLLAALSWLRDEVERRKPAFAAATAQKRKKTAAMARRSQR